MKKILLSLLFIAGISITINAQTTWTYDFGTSTKTPYNTASGTSTSYLPTPSTNGGIAFVRIGTGSGAFELVTSGNAGGTGAELKGTASISTSINKFSLHSFSGSAVASISFKVKFEGGTNGSWSFYAGKGVGNYANGSALGISDAFAALRWNYGASNTISTERLNPSSSWVSTGITGTPFTQNAIHNIEIYINNSANNANYLRGTSQSLNKQCFDLWVNGVKVIENIEKAGLAAGDIIDSFGFTGISSTLPSNNSATIYLDNFSYTNSLPEVPLPVSLTSFTTKANLQNIDLAWNTASEKDNSHFEVLRSGDGKTFTKIGEVKGAGTTDAATDYSFVDRNALPGVNYYQLNQIDYNGNATLSKVEAVKSNVAASNFKVAASKQDGTIKLTVFAANEGKATLKIYDINGRKVTEKELSLSKGYSNISVPFNGGNGLHIASLTTATETVTQKFIQ